MLLQPKFVLPEFFMHVHFPAEVNSSGGGSSGYDGSGGGNDGSNSKDSASASSSRSHSISNMLTPSAPPLSRSDGVISGKKDHNSSSSSSSRDPLFPLENMLMQNALQCLERENSSGGDSANIEYESQEDVQRARATSSNSSSIVTPQQSLMRKQAIVEALHSAVQEFSFSKDALLQQYVRNISKKLDT